MRKIGFYPFSSPYKVNSIVIMLFYPGSYGKDIRIENYILGRKSQFINKQAVGPLCNFDLSFKCIGLAMFIKEHYYSRSAIFSYFMRMFKERFLSFLKTYGVNN